MQIADVPKKDWEQIFNHIVVKHKPSDSWCYVVGFDDNIIHLRRYHQKCGLDRLGFTDEFTDEIIALSTPSLGMCNTRNGAFFLQRKPSRVMKGGVVMETLQKAPVSVKRDAEGHAYRYEQSYSEINHMFNKEYPTLEEVVIYSKEMARSIAFDRQFAVCWNGKVYYKGNLKAVGAIHLDIASAKPVIVWNKGYEILETVLGDNCAKSLYATKQAPKSRVARN